MKIAIIAIPFSAVIIAGCGPQSAEDARAHAVDKCERQFGRLSPDASKGEALCSCMTDRLAAEGLEITDMLGGDRAKVEAIGKSCAKEAGIAVPQN